MDKKTVISIIIFYAMVIALTYILRFFRTKSSKRKGGEILKLYSNENLKSIEVKISETRSYRFSNHGGTLGFLNSTMHYSEDILIFTQSGNSNFEKLNFTLPLVIQPKTIKSIFIKSDEYILYLGNPITEKKIQVYTESAKDNDLLKIIFSDFKENILKA
ncbi:hypothetical protein EYY60_11710 [Flavobacterium zhairuonense]|uniref:hypothetical protein n=1 Tax=Flavobacterium zhairuonense TaxID=2493631 RepID=UPI001053615F|nr:hypothetical protein [Flavobacterium zhairuonense]KAF2510169.1 hypothetical protein EYY60_11710 [Flavobacterium zhairuonense]